MKARFSTVGKAIVFWAALSLPGAAFQPCEPEAVISDFDRSARPVDGFDREQKQLGDIVLATDPLSGSNVTARMVAGPKFAGKVGKADLILGFDPLGAGHRVQMRGRFFFPAGSRLDSVILMDLECATCGLDTNPGIRLYLRRGYLRVDRSKIGYAETFNQNVPLKLRTDTWHDIIWQVDLGKGEAGGSTVLLDGAEVMNAVGTTIPTKEAARKVTNKPIRELVDRFQIGLTANSNSVAQTLYLDTVTFCTQ